MESYNATWRRLAMEYDDSSYFAEAQQSRIIELEFDTDAFSMARRLELEFDNAIEPGEIIELDEEEEMNVVIISHILSKCESGEFDCPICYETIDTNKRITISCNHSFCLSCTKTLLKTCNQTKTKARCPMCRYDCFLMETPDETQFKDIGGMLDEFDELKKIYELDLRRTDSM